MPGCQGSLRLLISPALAAIAGVMLLPSLSQAGVTFFNIFKTQHFTQTSNDPAAAPDGFSAQGVVYFTDPADLTKATASAGGGSVEFTDVGVPSSPGGYYTRSIGATYPTFAALNAAIPATGTALYTISGGTLGTQSATITGPGVDLYSNMPYFTGHTYSSFQGMHPNQEHSITGNGFNVVSGANDSHIYLNIYRASDGVSVYGGIGNPAETSTVLPSDILQPFTSYVMSATYSSRLSIPNAGFNGATAQLVWDSQTDIHFTTVPEASTFVLTALAGGGLLTLSYWRRSQAVNCK